MGSNPVGVTNKKGQHTLFFFIAVLTNGRTKVRSLAVDGKPLANFVCLPLIKGQKPVGVTKKKSRFLPAFLFDFNVALNPLVRTPLTGIKKEQSPS